MTELVNKVKCLIIEDEPLSIEMLQDYIGRRNDLYLIGIASQLIEVEEIVRKGHPSIIFLDLIIPIGGLTSFHIGKLPKSAQIVVTSALPLSNFKGKLPKGNIFELNKPISFKNFNHCINEIIVKKPEF